MATPDELIRRHSKFNKSIDELINTKPGPGGKKDTNALEALVQGRPKIDVYDRFKLAKNRAARERVMEEAREEKRLGKAKRMEVALAKLDKIDRRDAIALVDLIRMNPHVNQGDLVADYAQRSRRKKIMGIPVETTEEKYRAYNRLLKKSGFLYNIHGKRMSIIVAEQKNFVPALRRYMNRVFREHGYKNQDAYDATARFMRDRVDGNEIIKYYKSEQASLDAERFYTELLEGLMRDKKLGLTVEQARRRMTPVRNIVIGDDVNFHYGKYKVKDFLKILKLRNLKEREDAFEKAVKIDEEIIFQKTINKMVGEMGFRDERASNKVPDGLIYAKNEKPYSATWREGKRKYFREVRYRFFHIPGIGAKANIARFKNARRKALLKERDKWMWYVKEGKMSHDQAIQVSEEIVEARMKVFQSDMISWKSWAGNNPVHVTFRVKGNALSKRRNLIPLSRLNGKPDYEWLEGLEKEMKRAVESKGGLYVVGSPDTEHKDHIHITFHPNPRESMSKQVEQVKDYIEDYVEETKETKIQFQKGFAFTGGGMRTLRSLIAYIKRNKEAGENKEVVRELEMEVLTAELE